jgi:hypothetical protein
MYFQFISFSVHYPIVALDVWSNLRTDRIKNGVSNISFYLRMICLSKVEVMLSEH